MRYRVSILSAVACLGLMTCTVHAGESEAVQTIAAILETFNGSPSDADKGALREIAGEKTSTADEKTLAKALLNVQHKVADGDKSKLEAIVKDGKALQSVKTLATIILNLNDTPSEADKEKLKELGS